MITMYHPQANEPISVNPSKVESMTAKGWTTEQPSPSKRKAKSKATETVEENNNGES